MIITRQSMISGKLHDMDLPVTNEQVDRWLKGELIHLVMPHLTDAQREFLMTGITPAEWHDTFGSGDEE